MIKGVGRMCTVLILTQCTGHILTLSVTYHHPAVLILLPSSTVKLWSSVGGKAQYTMTARIFLTLPRVPGSVPYFLTPNPRRRILNRNHRTLSRNHRTLNRNHRFLCRNHRPLRHNLRILQRCLSIQHRVAPTPLSSITAKFTSLEEETASQPSTIYGRSMFLD